MKILALDIDGVLANPATKFKSFDPECLAALRRILEQVSDCKMVLSSCWRHGFIDWDNKEHPLVGRDNAIPVIKQWFLKMGWTQELADRLIDKTPDVRGEHRGSEISEWVKRHPEVSHVCVIDDDSDIEPFHSVHVHTDGDIGLTQADAEKAIFLLTSST